MESGTHVLKKSFNLGICRPAVLSFCCFVGKWVGGSNSVSWGLVSLLPQAVMAREGILSPMLWAERLCS